MSCISSRRRNATDCQINDVKKAKNVGGICRRAYMFELMVHDAKLVVKLEGAQATNLSKTVASNMLNFVTFCFVNLSTAKPTPWDNQGLLKPDDIKTLEPILKYVIDLVLDSKAGKCDRTGLLIPLMYTSVYNELELKSRMMRNAYIPVIAFSTVLSLVHEFIAYIKVRHSNYMSSFALHFRAMSTLSNFGAIVVLLTSDPHSWRLASHAIRQLHGLEKSFEKEAEDLLEKIAFAVRNVSYSDGLLAVISMDSQFWEKLIEKAKRSRVEMRGFIVLRIHGFGTLQAGLAKKDDPSGPTDPNSIVGQVIAVLKSSEIANTLASMDTAKKIASIIGDDAGISVVSKDILAIATRQLIATQVNAFLTNDEKTESVEQHAILHKLSIFLLSGYDNLGSCGRDVPRVS
ncbi:hypothetical protein L596_021470 [Steinernema carpocapsae]|uniref:Uncharacterized protein n=1 Tax=Steinernema carpocapsae TaxID=34508 RepID=A0A4U5MIV7_STECR|nr:hypothetical protein L596_021470 [Steinernema carpocapsae]